jgi:site-specific recombinase XerC
MNTWIAPMHDAATDEYTNNRSRPNRAMGRRGRRHRIGDGLYEDESGLSAVVKVGRRQREKRFRPSGDREADLLRMQRWQLRARAELIGDQPLRPSHETFVAAVPRFLATLPAGSPIRYDYEKLLARWLHTPLAAVPMPAIRHLQILTQLATWEAAGVAASTLNHLVRALRRLYDVINSDDEQASNPCSKIPRYREPDPVSRGTDHLIIEGILACLPDVGYSAGRVERPAVSKTKARLRVMAWTGLPPALIRQIRPEHIHWESRELEVAPRRKGKGVRARRLPLLDGAVAALRAFDEADAYGSYSNAAPWMAWQRAKRRFIAQMRAAKIGAAALDELQRVLAELRPYDLRHSFGADVYRHSQNLKAVKDLLMHSSLHTSERYITSAVDEVSRSALEAVQKARTRASRVPSSLPSKAVSGRKREDLSPAPKGASATKRREIS